MASAYRIPDNECACVEPGTTPAATVPIGRFNVRSFITSVADGAKVPANRTTADPRYRLRRRPGHHVGGVLDATAARPGDRRDSARVTGATRSVSGPRRSGPIARVTFLLQVRATNAAGETQPATPPGIPPATCATSSRRFGSRWPEMPIRLRPLLVNARRHCRLDDGVRRRAADVHSAARDRRLQGE